MDHELPVVSITPVDIQKGLLKVKVDESKLPRRSATHVRVFDIDGELQTDMTPGERRFKRAEAVTVTLVQTTSYPVQTTITLHGQSGSHTFRVEVEATMKVIDPLLYVGQGRPSSKAMLTSFAQRFSGSEAQRFASFQAVELQNHLDSVLRNAMASHQTGFADHGLELSWISSKVPMSAEDQAAARERVNVTAQLETLKAKHAVETSRDQLQRERAEELALWSQQYGTEEALLYLEMERFPERFGELSKELRAARKEERDMLIRLFQQENPGMIQGAMRGRIDRVFGATPPLPPPTAGQLPGAAGMLPTSASVTADSSDGFEEL